MKKTIRLLCPAKINLSLDITGKRPDNYHMLESIFQNVSVYDRLEVTVEDGEGIFLTCDVPDIPCDEKNIAYKAADLFLKFSGIQSKVSIHLEKGIPSQAGMGGGSTDAAGVLYALNQLMDSHYENAVLRKIGVKLGADVPFFLMGGTVLAQGIGEVLTPLKSLPEWSLVILKGKQGVSTPEAYRAVDALVNPVHPDTESMLRAVESQDFDSLCQHCGNLFETAVHLEEVQNARTTLLDNGAECAVMTGSGAAVFGIFRDSEKAELCAERLKSAFAFAQACHMIQEPFTILSEGGMT